MAKTKTFFPSILKVFSLAAMVSGVIGLREPDEGIWISSQPPPSLLMMLWMIPFCWSVAPRITAPAPSPNSGQVVLSSKSRIFE